MNDNAQFDNFWQFHPSRKPHSNPKKPAKEKFSAAVKRGISPEAIICGVENYSIYVNQENVKPKFVAQAKTWLNEERWTDFQEPPEHDGQPWQGSL